MCESYVPSQENRAAIGICLPWSHTGFIAQGCTSEWIVKKPKFPNQNEDQRLRKGRHPVPLKRKDLIPAKSRPGRRIWLCYQKKTGEQRIDDALIEIASRVGDTVDTQSDMISTMNVHSDNLLMNKRKIDDLQSENQRLTKRLNNMDAAFKSAMERVGAVEKTADANSQMLRNGNIVVDGLAEMDNENCLSRVIEIFKEIDIKFSKNDIISAYRVGQKSTDGKFVRPVVVKFNKTVVKLILMENKGRLMTHPEYGRIFLNDDLPQKIKKERKTLREISQYAHHLGYQGCRASGSKLVINGKAYRYETLHLLPQELQLCNLKTRKVGDGIGFQGESSRNLSNFYPVTLTVEGQCFNCAEQAFQFFKARTCKRDDMADIILSMSNPRDIKAAGESFDVTAVWESHKERFMRSVVYSKFAQNRTLK